MWFDSPQSPSPLTYLDQLEDQIIHTGSDYAGRRQNLGIGSPTRVELHQKRGPARLTVKLVIRFNMGNKL